jgi:hypothetical protein
LPVFNCPPRKVQLSGNEIIPDFTHALNELKFFRYRLGSSGFPPSLPLFSDDGAVFYDADDRTIGGSGFRPPFITTTEPATVAPIPEPSTMLLMLAGGAVLLRGRVIRRRSSDSDVEGAADRDHLPRHQ